MASPSTSVNGPAEFPMFPRLPKELRLMIWKKTFPGPRLLEIKYHHGNYEDDGPVMQGYFDSECPLPILYSACKESHSEFRHQYSISFPRMVRGPGIYFDPVVDTIVIARCTTPTSQSLTDPNEEEQDPLIYPGGDVFNQIENICFASFSLLTALRFLKDVDIFDGYLRVKAIIIAIELDGAESVVIPMGDNARIGEPSLEEVQQTEEEEELCNSVIARFSTAFAERFPDRALPAVKVMAIRRQKLRMT